MNVEGIINVAGKPGLYKVISKSNNTVIIESLIEKKRSPIYSHNQANLLEEIGIYTYEDTTSLSVIFDFFIITFFPIYTGSTIWVFVPFRFTENKSSYLCFFNKKW